mmetsp:Transcript_56545/g.183821  ORF Transcript_56545/g.183821 Transcript_56545/m.183821 type:complete len:500 (-) Transcript_56545:121-1620(-)
MAPDTSRGGAPRCPASERRSAVAVGMNLPISRYMPSFLPYIASHLVEPLKAHIYLHLKGPVEVQPQAAEHLRRVFGRHRAVLRTSEDESAEEVVRAAFGETFRPEEHACMLQPRRADAHGFLPFRGQPEWQQQWAVNRGLRILYAVALIYQDMTFCERSGSASGANGLYRWMVWTRADLLWMHNHPPLSLLRRDHIWIPDGNDNFVGLNDQHATVPRHLAEVFFNSFWNASNLDDIFAACGTTEKFEFDNLDYGCSAERYLRCFLRRHRVPVARFLPVAALGKPAATWDCEELNRNTGGQKAICPKDKDCDTFLLGDSTLASSVAVRLRYGWQWQHAHRKQLLMEPQCADGPGVLQQCCVAAWQPKRHNHFCFGAWDPTYGHAELNLERCCADAYQAHTRRGQPILLPLPVERTGALHCFHCGKAGVHPCLLCACPGSNATPARDCTQPALEEVGVIPQATICRGKLSFEFMGFKAPEKKPGEKLRSRYRVRPSNGSVS